MANISYDQLRANLKVTGFMPVKFRFVSRTILAGGCLPNVDAAHACWMYCRQAMVMLHEIQEGAQYEGENDHVNMLNNIARSVAAQYELESPAEMLKYMPDCLMEAVRDDLPWDRRIETPWLDPYINHTAG